jgi:small subunit ribosomal protein S20
LPQRKAGLKRLRADKTRHLRNIKIKQNLKKSLKKFKLLLSDKKKQELLVALKEAFSKLDKAAAKGIIHKKTASRKKGRLHKKYSQAISSSAGKV